MVLLRPGSTRQLAGRYFLMEPPNRHQNKPSFAPCRFNCCCCCFISTHLFRPRLSQPNTILSPTVSRPASCACHNRAESRTTKEISTRYTVEMRMKNQEGKGLMLLEHGSTASIRRGLECRVGSPTARIFWVAVTVECVSDSDAATRRTCRAYPRLVLLQWSDKCILEGPT